MKYPTTKGRNDMIVVTGATGNVGSEIVALLAASGRPVRAMTRRPGEVRLPEGVETVYGDAADPASLDEAFRGAEGAFLMTTQQMGTAPHPTHGINLAEAASRASLQRVVQLSSFAVGANGLFRWYAEAEAAVAGTGIDYTILKPGRFMSNALQWAPMIRHGDEVHVPFATKPAASIDPADIAAIAVAALTTGAHRNTACQLSGPQVLTPAEELEILAETLQRPLHLIELSTGQAKAGMRASGMPPGIVDEMITNYLETDVGAHVLPEMHRLLGRQPNTFAQWARNHASAFTFQEETTTETSNANVH